MQTFQVYRLEGEGDNIEKIVPLVQITLPTPPRLSEVRAALVKIGLVTDTEKCETTGDKGLYFLKTPTKHYEVWWLRAKT